MTPVAVSATSQQCTQIRSVNTFLSLNQMRPKVTAIETEKYWPKSQTTYHAVDLYASTMTATENGKTSSDAFLKLQTKTDGENGSWTQPSERYWSRRREIGHCLTVRWQCGNKHHTFILQPSPHSIKYTRWLRTTHNAMHMCHGAQKCRSINSGFWFMSCERMNNRTESCRVLMCSKMSQRLE